MTLSSPGYTSPLDGDLAKVVSALDEDAREYFEERAGILEFDGCLPRGKAERLAWKETQVYLERRLASGRSA